MMYNLKTELQGEQKEHSSDLTIQNSFYNLIITPDKPLFNKRGKLSLKPLFYIILSAM